jgi:hypothetical protein
MCIEVFSPLASDRKHLFQLEHSDEKFLFSAATLDQKNQWLGKIRKLLKTYQLRVRLLSLSTSPLTLFLSLSLSSYVISVAEPITQCTS